MALLQAKSSDPKTTAGEKRLAKLQEQSDKLKQQLQMDCIPVSDASRESVVYMMSTKRWTILYANSFDGDSSLINYCNNTKDAMLPSVWGREMETLWLEHQAAGCQCQIM
jgi:hypothetical protein